VSETCPKAGSKRGRWPDFGKIATSLTDQADQADQVTRLHVSERLYVSTSLNVDQADQADQADQVTRLHWIGYCRCSDRMFGCVDGRGTARGVVVTFATCHNATSRLRIVNDWPTVLPVRQLRSTMRAVGRLMRRHEKL